MSAKKKTIAPRTSAKPHLLDKEETWLAALGAKILMDCEEEGASIVTEFEPRALAQKLRRRLNSAQRAHLDHVIQQLHEWQDIGRDHEGETPWDPEEQWTGPSYDPGLTRPTLEQAIKIHADVEIDYFTHARGEFATRRVTPHDIDGRYFTGYCHLREEDRKFRIERVARIKLLRGKAKKQ